jgi:hypothetical protein
VNKQTPNFRLHMLGIIIVAIGCFARGGALLASRGADLDGFLLLIGGTSFAYAAYHGRHYLKR